MAHLEGLDLTLNEKIFKPIHKFGEFIAGDKESKTYSTRKTFFEGLLGIFGFIIINSLVKKF